MCKHDEWMKICVLCGEVLETTENKSSIVTSAEMNKTVYASAQQSVQADASPVELCEHENTRGACWSPTCKFYYNGERR